jgi:putative ABC transport system ATP-binding protein
MIRLENVSKTFNRNTANENSVLDHFNLEFRKNEFTVMIGGNGSGKSTILNLIAGSVKPDSGNIILDGNNITSLPDYKRSKYISRIFQDPLAGTAPELSVLENFRLASLRSGKKNAVLGINSSFRKKITDRVAGIGLGLENKIDQPVGSLSGGQRQALTLLMATADQTELLLLDEPVAALDPRTAETVMNLANDLIRKLNLTAIMVTHSMKHAVEFGDRTIMLKNGQISKDLNAKERMNVGLKDLYDWFEG